MNTKFSQQSGFSILELIVTVSLSTALMGGVVMSFSELSNPARHGAFAISSYMEMARAQAISSTSTVIVRPLDVQTIQGYLADDCGDLTPTSDSELLVRLPNEYSLTDLTWEICYTPRGFATVSGSIPLVDTFGTNQIIDVFLGGGVRVS